eukprot:m.48777 g.48777  ORF g.48777 m.48777 type:complete len:74 (+) comp47795_c0_seq2:84-305(+)
MADADAEEFSRWAATASTNAQRTELNKQLSRIESAINYFEHLQALLRVSSVPCSGLLSLFRSVPSVYRLRKTR